MTEQQTVFIFIVKKLTYLTTVNNVRTCILLRVKKIKIMPGIFIKTENTFPNLLQNVVSVSHYSDLFWYV